MDKKKGEYYKKFLIDDPVHYLTASVVTNRNLLSNINTVDGDEIRKRNIPRFLELISSYLEIEDLDKDFHNHDIKKYFFLTKERWEVIGIISTLIGVIYAILTYYKPS